MQMTMVAVRIAVGAMLLMTVALVRHDLMQTSLVSEHKLLDEHQEDKHKTSKMQVRKVEVEQTSAKKARKLVSAKDNVKPVENDDKEEKESEFPQDMDSKQQEEKHGSEEFSKKNESKTKEDMTTFAELAGLRMQPPFYMTGISIIIKPIVNVVVFGPSRPQPHDSSMFGQVKFLGKQVVQGAFLALALVQAGMDVKDSWYLAYANISLWDKILLLPVVFASSPNLVTGWNMNALSTLMDTSLTWSQQHGHLVGVTVFKAAGPIGCLYMIAMQMVYAPICLLLIIFSIPAIVAYFYISIPVLAIAWITYILLSWCFPAFVHALRGPPSNLLVSAADTEESKKKILIKLVNNLDVNLTRENDDQMSTYIDTQYAVEMWSYQNTGVPRQAWMNFWGTSIMFPPFFMFFPILTARWYSGRGYWTSLSTTLGERHLSVYKERLIHGMSTKLKLIGLWI